MACRGAELQLSLSLVLSQTAAKSKLLLPPGCLFVETSLVQEVTVRDMCRLLYLAPGGMHESMDDMKKLQGPGCLSKQPYMSALDCLNAQVLKKTTH